MDNERDRTWPEEDRPAEEASQADATGSPDAPMTEPGEDARSADAQMAEQAAPPEVESWPTADVPSASADQRMAEQAAPAEIESWPSADASAPAPEPAGEDPGVGSTEAAGPAPWPTEPPAAESATPDAWPTLAPERGASEWGREESATAWGSTGAADADATEMGAGAAADAQEPAAPEPTATEERPPEEVEAYPATEPSASDAATAAAAGTAAAHAVPDAEGTVGESTLCPRCGTENRPGLSFCRNCGQRLVAAGVATTVERPGAPEGTQACPRCGTHNRAGVAFCQNCGANLRGTSAGYVPPAASTAEAEAGAPAATRGAVLGPVVLLIGLAGLITAYLLPFPYGSGSLFERAWGGDGYGIAFWDGYSAAGASLADQAYFGLTAPSPLLGLLLVVLAVAGFRRAAPGTLQIVGLGIALLWSVALVVLFVLVEVAGNWGGDFVGLLRDLTPGGIIFFLSSLIVLIGTLTRFSRG